MKHTYDEVAREVDEIADGLGMRIDEHIKKAVIALRLWDFPTDGSCEGHLRRALAYPWIEIYAPDQEEKAWITANNYERKRLNELLDQFYNTDKYHHRFVYQDIGIFGGFRLVSGAVKAGQKPDSKLLREYREDFDSLADFLVNLL